jgi:DNA repair protein RadC
MKPKNKISEVKVSYNPNVDLSKQPKITRSFQAFQILRNSWDEGKIQHVEEFKILLLTRANTVIGIVHISTGGVSQTVVDPKLVFQAAINANATSIVLCHNHPSGSLRPSKADIDVTIKLAAGAKIFDMVIHDHIILNKMTYLSMADDGIL